MSSEGLYRQVQALFLFYEYHICYFQGNRSLTPIDPLTLKKVALLYQSQLSPARNGVQKPMKPGGYSDSGADIACEIKKHGIEVITPTPSPSIDQDFDWVFPDNKAGIDGALAMGADTLWLNTVLYAGHPIEDYFQKSIHFVGQHPAQVEKHDDKILTNALLAEHGLTVPQNRVITQENWQDQLAGLDYPLVVKPILGRGSQGVHLLTSRAALTERVTALFASQQYGQSLYLEAFLPGKEITITVMPGGKYRMANEEKVFNKPWCLPAVGRYNHIDGVAPYNGTVAVMDNSSVLSDEELASPAIQKTYEQCEKAAALVELKAPIRIDCRANEHGEYILFDLNMKPNMTGPSRPHRQNQDSLSMLAARKIGWDYFDLLNNILAQRWTGA